MKTKLYSALGIFVIVVSGVIIAIFLTSKKTGSVIDISIPSKGRVFHRASSVILGPGTSQNLYFHTSGWFIKKIEFRLPDFSDTDFEIKSLITIKGEKPKIEDWSEIGKKTFCLDERKEKVKDIVLTITNNSASTTLKEDLQIFAMRDGCNEWSGNFKYQWTDEGKNKTEQGILQTIFTLKENAYATEYAVSDGGYTYNLLGCEKDKETRTYTILSDGLFLENSLRLIPQDNGTYELKIPLVWGETDLAREYIKKNRTCVYGKEIGDRVKEMKTQTVKTLPDIINQKLILTPDVLTGNLHGEEELTAKLSDGTERKILIEWDLVRQ